MEIFGIDVGTGQVIGGIIGSLTVVILVRTYYKIKAKIRQAKK